MPAPVPENEQQRLSALYRYEVLDTLPELAFTRIVNLAAEVLDVPVAIINFIDRDRQWGKACFGLADSEAPRTDSFCAWAILEDDVLVIENAHSDPRFAANPMVTGEPHVHLYAGAPLITPEGFHIGTLCVTDHQPHPFGERERRRLREFAALAMDELEFRLSRARLSREVQAQARLLAKLAESSAQAKAIADVWMLLDTDLDPDLKADLSTDIIARAAGLDWAGVGHIEHGLLHARTLWASPRISAHWQEDLVHGVPVQLARTLSAFQRGANTFFDETEFGLQQEPFVAEGKLRALCVVPLGSHGAASSCWIGARLAGRRGWTDEDRQLIEAVARQYELSLSRQAQLHARD